MQLSSKHIFRASDHDNKEWNQVEDGPFGNTQSLQAINRWVQHAGPCAHASLPPSFTPPHPVCPLPLDVLTLDDLHYTLAPFLLCARSDLLCWSHCCPISPLSFCAGTDILTRALLLVYRRVKVVHVLPGESEPDDCDYWWSQEHDRRFFTFIDKYPGGSQPDFVNHLSAGHRVRLRTSSPHLTGSILQTPLFGKLEAYSALWQDVVCLACCNPKNVKGFHSTE